MPYAVDGQISQRPLPGGIEITDEQYRTALDGMLSGQHIQVVAGEMVVGALPELVPEDPAPPTPEQLREQWKVRRAEAVSVIKVTTAAGNTFDGDEISQGRMARAIIALDFSAPGSTVGWVLADNSVIDAAPAELREALALAGSVQAAIWIAE